MWICNILGHGYRQLEEQAAGFTRSTFFCKRCADRHVIDYFDPTFNAPETFKRYWDQTRTSYFDRVTEWGEKVKDTFSRLDYKDRIVKRLVSYEYDDKGKLVIKTK